MTNGIDGTVIALDRTDRPRGRPVTGADDGLGARIPGQAYAGWQPVRRAERQQCAERLLPAADMIMMLVVAARTGADIGMYLAAPITLAASYGVFGLYRPRLTLSVLDDLPRLLAGMAVGVGTGLTFSGPRADVPVGYVLRTILAGIAAVVVSRAIGYPLARRSRKRRLGAPTLIVGGAQVGCRLGQILLNQPEYGLLPVGYLDCAQGGRRRDLPAPLLGDHRDLAWLLAALEVRHVVVAFGAVKPSALVEVLRTCARLKCEILVVPRLYELHQRTRDGDHVRGIPLVRMRPAAPRRPTWRLKRLMDVAVAGTGLLLALPVLALCSVAVRLEGGRGVLFRQERVSLDGRRFQILKLRSMRPASAQESQSRWSVTGDRRVGPVGKLLRATSLDELPQLVNVLRGEMSLVGPRPERPYFVEQFGRQYPRYTDRHRVPAGLTGWAAVNGLRGDTSIDDRIRYDNNYIEDWSLWFDIKIMVRTLGAILTRAGG
ncbi:MAG TPA: sugar transferase [Mycobacteriales bacterium]|nr:sugar transferase [Mycobacteriales bacterium]